MAFYVIVLTFPSHSWHIWMHYHPSSEATHALAVHGHIPITCGKWPSGPLGVAFGGSDDLYPCMYIIVTLPYPILGISLPLFARWHSILYNWVIVFAVVHFQALRFIVMGLPSPPLE